MLKRNIPIFLIFLITCAIGIVGYLIPQPEEKLPVRILLENSGGNVVFDHEKHNVNYNIECIECHHEMPITGNKEMDEAAIIPCSSCHGIDYNTAFVASHQEEFADPFLCATCHHYQFEKSTWDHDMHAEMTECTSCHHDTDIEPEPMNCINCHAAGYASPEDVVPSLKNAVHVKCYDCHTDWYDAELEGCNACHTDQTSREKLVNDDTYVFNTDQASCANCHEENTANDLILGRMDSSHISCMGCHEREDKGPYLPDQCSQCHGK